MDAPPPGFYAAPHLFFARPIAPRTPKRQEIRRTTSKEITIDEEQQESVVIKELLPRKIPSPSKK